MIYGPNMVRFLIQEYKSDNKVVKKLLKEVSATDVTFDGKVYFDINFNIHEKPMITYYVANQVIDKEGTIAYEDTRLCKINIGYTNKMQIMKPGKFANSLNIKSLVDKDIETFNELLNSFFEYDIEIRESYEDIIKYYNKDNYLMDGEGSLGGSCMRYSNEIKRKQLKLYSDSNVKLVIVRDIVDNSKIISRALLWDNVNIEYVNSLGKKVSEKHTLLDRIYTHKTSHVGILKKFAKDNGYVCKYEQSYNQKTGVVFPDGKMYNAIMTTEININDSLFPYIDTFTYTSEDVDNEGTISITNDKSNAIYAFTDYDSGGINDGPNRYVESIFQGGDIERINAIYSECMEDWFYQEDAIELNGGDDVCHVDKSTVINDIVYYIHDNLISYSSIYGKYMIKSSNDKYVLNISSGNFTRVRNENSEWSEEKECYVFVDNSTENEIVNIELETV